MELRNTSILILFTGLLLTASLAAATTTSDDDSKEAPVRFDHRGLTTYRHRAPATTANSPRPRRRSRSRDRGAAAASDDRDRDRDRRRAELAQPIRFSDAPAGRGKHPSLLEKQTFANQLVALLARLEENKPIQQAAAETAADAETADLIASLAHVSLALDATPQKDATL